MQKSEVFPPYEELGSEKNGAGGKDLLNLSKSKSGDDFDIRKGYVGSQTKDDEKKVFLTATNQMGSEPRFIEKEE